MGLIKATFLTHSGAYRRRSASNLVFGSSLTILLALLSVVSGFWRSEPNPMYLMLAAVSLLITLWYPQVYTPLNQAWRALSLGLSHVFIVALWIFYILPFGLFMQARGRDPLRLKFNPDAETYWQPASPRGNMQKPL